MAEISKGGLFAGTNFRIVPVKALPSTSDAVIICAKIQLVSTYLIALSDRQPLSTTGSATDSITILYSQECPPIGVGGLVCKGLHSHCSFCEAIKALIRSNFQFGM
jgi:hypothetical protein